MLASIALGLAAISTILGATYAGQKPTTPSVDFLAAGNTGYQNPNCIPSPTRVTTTIPNP